MKKFLIICVYLAVCSSCGGRVGDCTVDGLGMILSEVPLDCNDMHFNYLLARDILAELEIVPKSNTGAFSNVDIIIRREEYWEIENGDSVIGRYWWPGTIYLSKYGNALLHEMLHHWDASNLTFRTGDHAGWDMNNYDFADIEFVSRYRPLTLLPIGP